MAIIDLRIARQGLKHTAKYNVTLNYDVIFTQTIVSVSEIWCLMCVSDMDLLEKSSGKA